MKQALHIFRKDVRHLWLPILVVLLLAAAHAVFDVLRSPLDIPETARVNQMAGLLSFLLVLSWWYLTAIVVYEERLPGDRQFWITRPYSSQSLLGAKLLFVFAFFNVPLFLSDCCILAAQHYPLLTNIPALLSRQFQLSLLLILPSFVLATVTTGVAQFVLAWFLLLLGLFAESFLIHSQGMLAVGGDASFSAKTIELAPLIAIAAGVIIWQYTKRRASIGRAVLAISVFALIPILTAVPRSRGIMFPEYSAETHQRIDPAKLNIRYGDADSSFCKDTNSTPPGFVHIELPLQIDNLPSETALLGIAEIRIASHHFSYPEQGSHIYSLFHRKADHYCQTINLEAKQFERIQSQPVTLRTTLYLTAVTNRPTLRVPAGTKTMAIPDVGSCQTDIGSYIGPQLLCQAGVYSPAATLVHIEYPGFRSEPVQIGNFHPDNEVVEGLSPVEKWVTYLGNSFAPSAQPGTALAHPGAVFVFTPQRPLGYGTKNLAAQNINLASYASLP